MSGMINNTPHYNISNIFCTCGKRIEFIDVARGFNYSLGNVIKYIWRFNLKNNSEDLLNAQWYLNDYIEKANEPVEFPIDSSFPECKL